MDYRTKEPENLSGPQRFGRWLALKQYQIEVTFGVYMFTPTEKFVFCTCLPVILPLILTFSLIVMCARVCMRCVQFTSSRLSTFSSKSSSSSSGQPVPRRGGGGGAFVSCAYDPVSFCLTHAHEVPAAWKKFSQKAAMFRAKNTGSVVFLLSAMGSIATILYLPQHILFIINRAWFYVSGGETVTAATATATTAAANLVHGASKIVDAAVKSAIDLGLESVVEGVATTLTALSSAASAAPTEILREL